VKWVDENLLDMQTAWSRKEVGLRGLREVKTALPGDGEGRTYFVNFCFLGPDSSCPVPKWTVLSLIGTCTILNRCGLRRKIV
jgi:hypothetical protein